MRLKTAMCLAVLTAGVATTMAQSNVYSLNIVGYVTYTQAANSFDIIANPLNTTNNTVVNVFPAAPSYLGLTVYKRNLGGGYDPSTFDQDLLVWTDPTLTVDPGTGFWLSTPPGTPFTNTFVGEVILNSTNPVPAGYSIKASVVPQAGLLQTDLNYQPNLGDGIFIWNGNGYDPYSYDPDLVAWAPNQPSIKVAQGFWLFNNTAAKNWIRNFSVGP